jgi:hypothetical protein
MTMTSMLQKKDQLVEQQKMT